MACCRLFPFSMRVSQNPTHPTSNLHVRDFACFVCVVNSEGESASSRRELKCKHASRDMNRSCRPSPQDPPSPQNAQKVSCKTYHEGNASQCSIYPPQCPEAHDRSGDLSPASTRSCQRISAPSPPPPLCPALRFAVLHLSPLSDCFPAYRTCSESPASTRLLRLRFFSVLSSVSLRFPLLRFPLLLFVVVSTCYPLQALLRRFPLLATAPYKTGAGARMQFCWDRHQ